VIHARQPDELFPWLGRMVGSRGPLACDDVLYDARGTLSFLLRAGQARVRVALAVAAPDAHPARHRSGSIGIEDAEGASEELRAAAVKQVIGCVDTVVAHGAKALLEPRNRDETLLELGPNFASRVCGGLLRAGETRCGTYRFEGASQAGGSVELVFRGLARRIALRVQPSGLPTDGPLVGRYGPLELVAVSPIGAGTDEERVARFAGYVLALCVHPGMQLWQPDPAAPRNDKANPFLFDAFSTKGLVISALFASRGRVVALLHTDRECAGFTSYLTGPLEPAYLSQAGLRPTAEYLRTMRIVDTNELDAIMTGCEAKLTALAQEVSRAPGRPELMVVLGTCVSRIIGDDVERAVRESGAEEAGVRTVWLETTSTQADQEHRALWARLVELFQAPPAHRDGPAVNLVGYGAWRTEGMPELERLLASVGIRRNACFVPTFDTAELARLGDADVNVVMPAPHVRDSLSWARSRLRAPSIEVPPPFGVAGTRAWVDAVLRFFGRPPVGDEWMREHFGPHASRWVRLVKAAGDVRVALVLTSDHFRSDEPRSRAGLPWFDVLREMGFGIDVFVLAAAGRPPGRRERDEALAAARAELRGARDSSLTWVDTLRELQRAVTGAASQLFYTEVPNDRRVLAAGKVPFNHTHFRMGFEGACGSLERLADMARTPFFRRHGAHLQAEDWR
jgi:hypothetical protein